MLILYTNIYIVALNLVHFLLALVILIFIIIIIIIIGILGIVFVVVVVVIFARNFPIDLIVFLCIARKPFEGAVLCAEVAGEELLGGAATPTKLKLNMYVKLR